MVNLDRTMKVKELIEKLQCMDPELPVVSEGCDCDGEVVDAQLIPAYGLRDGKTVVYLARGEEG